MEKSQKIFLSLEQIHNEQTKMLEQIANFCNINKITYYICGGTLLGAIRHKGFIPWDDDVDIMMPREEFEKFEKITQEKDIANYLKVISYDNKNMNSPYCKVMNEKLKIDDSCLKDPLEPYLWIDVFPMDGLSENDEENKKLYKKVIKNRKLLLMLYSEENYIENFSKSNIKRFIKKVIRFLYRGKGKEKIARKLDNLSKTYNYNESQYVGGVVWGYGPQERMLKSEMQNVTVEFEGINVNTFSCYDKYLTNLYGDYMQLPPEEQRVNHEIKVYRIEE